MARVKGIIGWIKAKRAAKHRSPWDLAGRDALEVMLDGQRLRNARRLP